MLPTLDAHQLSQLVLALGKLGAKPTPAYMAAVLFASQARLHAFGPRAMVATVSGIASMGGPGVAQLPAKSTEVWVASVLEAAWPMLDQSDKSDLGTGAPATAAGSVSGSASASISSMDADSDAWAPSPLFNAQEVALVLHAMVRMGVQPGPAWLQRALSCLEHGPGMMASLAADSAALAMLLWTLPDLLQPPSAVAAAGSSHAEAAAASSSSSNGTVSSSQLDARGQLPPTFLQSLAQAAMPKLRHYEALELAKLMQAFAYWGYVPSRAWIARFWWSTYKLMSSHSMPAPALTVILRALVRLQLQPHSAWWQAAFQAARGRFGEFEPHHFSVLLRTMSDLRYRPGSTWFRSYLLATYRCWGHFTARDWSEMLLAMARFRVGDAVGCCSVVVRLCPNSVCSCTHRLKAAGAGAKRAKPRSTLHG